MRSQLTYKAYGSKAILIEWEPKISEDILFDIIRLRDQILIEKQSQISDCIVGYHSLTIVYKDELLNANDQIEQLQQIYSLAPKKLVKKPSLWTIPVCYDECFGLDLEDISRQKNIPIKTIIDLHIVPYYTVYFVGFLPGFLYLGGLDERLHTPRKPTPRLIVEQGAVAIGGRQTGVYPQRSAGGWNIIGNSPLPFFDIDKSPQCFATSGDKIKFESIDLDRYQKLKEEAKLGTLNIQNFRTNA